jgi:hypothetical protein
MQTAKSPSGNVANRGFGDSATPTKAELATESELPDNINPWQVANRNSVFLTIV